MAAGLPGRANDLIIVDDIALGSRAVPLGRTRLSHASRCWETRSPALATIARFESSLERPRPARSPGGRSPGARYDSTVCPAGSSILPAAPPPISTLYIGPRVGRSLRSGDYCIN